MYHDGCRHIFHESYVFGREFLSRLVVYNTVGTNLVSIGRDDGDSSVKLPSVVCSVCLVVEPFVFGQVGNDKDGVVLSLVDIVEGKTDGVLANAPFLENGCDTLSKVQLA